MLTGMMHRWRCTDERRQASVWGCGMSIHYPRTTGTTLHQRL